MKPLPRNNLKPPPLPEKRLRDKNAASYLETIRENEKLNYSSSKDLDIINTSSQNQIITNNTQK